VHRLSQLDPGAEAPAVERLAGAVACEASGLCGAGGARIRPYGARRVAAARRRRTTALLERRRSVYASREAPAAVAAAARVARRRHVLGRDSSDSRAVRGGRARADARQLDVVRRSQAAPPR